MSISYQFLGASFLPILVALAVLWFRVEDAATHIQLLFVTVLSFIAFLGTFKLIPPVSELCIKADLFGKDINKGGTTKIPETQGIVVGTVYLVVVIMFQPLFASMLGEYNAALTSICFMTLLGFADDVLDLRWSIKISLSLLATLPLLVSYSGPTLIIIPKPLRFILGFSTNLGVLYHLYMSLMAVFCTNSINILAGINGLEVGQSLVIGFSVLVHCAIQFVYVEANESTLLAIFLIVPFIATSLALWYYNRYPSRVFVGDTYTYFAGMTLAVVGTLGHFSKTLMLFFIPQLINFAISLPQLFGFIPCPRHRLPRFNAKTGKLECIKTNWNLINLFLYILGPMTEKDLCTAVLAFHVLCSFVAFFIRYYLASFFY